MTLHAALVKLKAADAFEAEPGPVRRAVGYVWGVLDARLPGHEETPEQWLELLVQIGDPLLFGALQCLLRHVAHDPYVCVRHREAPASLDPWVLDGAYRTADPPPWFGISGPTEIDAVARALIAYAQALP